MITATDVQAHVRAANSMFCEALRRGAPEEMASLYTGDAEVLAPGSGTVRGHQAIEEFWHGTLDMGIRNIELDLPLDPAGIRLRGVRPAMGGPHRVGPLSH